MGNVKVSEFKGRVIEVGNKQHAAGGGPKDFQYDVFLDGMKVGQVEKCDGGWAVFAGDRNWCGNQAAYRGPVKSRKGAAEDVAFKFIQYLEGK